MRVLNRTTKQLVHSANTPDYPIGEWIHDPDLSAVAGFDPKYWEISGDSVTLMDQAGRDAVDAAEQVARRNAIADEFDETQSFIRSGLATMLDLVNIERAADGRSQISGAQFKAAVRTKLDG